VKALALIALLFALLAVPAGSAQVRTDPRISIFYYPWYGNPARDSGWEHWMMSGTPTDVASNFYPVRGLYSSSSEPVVRAQMREIASAGVQEVVSSWWGWGSPEDVRLPLVIKAAHAAGLSVAVHIEPYPGRTIETVRSDIEHLRTLGVTRFFVYRPFDIPVEDWAALRAEEDGIELFAQTNLVGKAQAGMFDGVYTYDVLLWGGNTFPRLCAQAHHLGLQCLPSVGPGYDATRATADLRVKPRRNGATYDGMWQSAIRSGADAVTITSYNEWHEGTQIEPARTSPPGAAAAATYESYAGAYGLTGRAAQDAYLVRTSFWSRAFLRSRLQQPRQL
jgi:hypothetical protein